MGSAAAIGEAALSARELRLQAVEREIARDVGLLAIIFTQLIVIGQRVEAAQPSAPALAHVGAIDRVVGAHEQARTGAEHAKQRRPLLVAAARLEIERVAPLGLPAHRHVTIVGELRAASGQRARLAEIDGRARLERIRQIGGEMPGEQAGQTNDGQRHDRAACARRRGEIGQVREIVVAGCCWRLLVGHFALAKTSIGFDTSAARKFRLAAARAAH